MNKFTKFHRQKGTDMTVKQQRAAEAEAAARATSSLEAATAHESAVVDASSINVAQKTLERMQNTYRFIQQASDLIETTAATLREQHNLPEAWGFVFNAGTARFVDRAQQQAAQPLPEGAEIVPA
jgi:predicted lipid-binding transport protein (Tim44 family)